MTRRVSSIGDRLVVASVEMTFVIVSDNREIRLIRQHMAVIDNLTRVAVVLSDATAIAAISPRVLVSSQSVALNS